MKAHKWVTIISIPTAAIINVAAHGATGWNGLGYLLCFGLIPLAALIVLLIISFFVSTSSRLEKLTIAIAVAYSVLFIVIALGTKPTFLDLLLPSGLWVFPLTVWNLLAQWFGRRRQASS